MRKSFIFAVVAVLVIVIVGGYLGYSYLSTNQNQNPNTPTTVSVDQIRDQAMTYVAANHTQTVTLMPTAHWAGGRVDTGLLGSETYQYTNGNWAVNITYPVVPSPTYAITCNYTLGGGLTWTGTYQNGLLTENSCSVSANTTLTETQMRDLTLQYLMAYHNETTSYMHDMSWTGGRMDMGMMVGSDKYNYQSNGWNVTMQNPVVPNPIYTITAEYTPANMHSAMMTWEGTLQNGTMTQSSYKYNP